MAGKNRLFVAQHLMDQWLSEGRVEVEKDVMITRPESQRFQLTTAVLFLSEVAGGGDGAGLLGKVKDLEQLAAMGAEHYADSVILGESAYQVAEGFAGAPVAEDESIATGSSLAAATRAAIGDDRDSRGGSGEIDLLARFLKSR